MKKAEIVIDDWKLAIFSKHLVAAGYHYEQMPGMTKGTYLLTVHYEGLAKLYNTIKAANEACARSKECKS